jgi:hypothetical protein
MAARFRRRTRRQLADLADAYAPRPAFSPRVLRGLERLGFLDPAEEAA